MKRESIIQGFLIYAALIFLVLTSGCVSVGPTVRTYSGDKLQESEVAVIKGWWSFMLLAYGGIDIYVIDGSPVKATKVEVLPGRHKLVIRDYSVSFVAPVGAPSQCAQVDYNFEAGHEYKIEYWSKGILIEGVKIIDVTTGATILSQPWGACEEAVPVYFSACIQPLSERHGTWSTDEVNTIREVIAAVAQRHGLEQKKTEERGYIAWYTLPRKFFDLSSKDFDLKAHYTNPPVPGVPCGWTVNTKDQTGTIFVGLMYRSGGPIITYLESEEVESVWKEMYELLQNKFGERVTPLRIP